VSHFRCKRFDLLHGKVEHKQIEASYIKSKYTAFGEIQTTMAVFALVIQMHQFNNILKAKPPSSNIEDDIRMQLNSPMWQLYGPAAS
jgi:hypothetical protein